MKVKLTKEQYLLVRHLHTTGHIDATPHSLWGVLLVKLSEKNVICVKHKNKIYSYLEHKIQAALGTVPNNIAPQFVLNPKIKTVSSLSKPPYKVVIDD